jgi:hypothetical protein
MRSATVFVVGLLFCLIGCTRTPEVASAAAAPDASPAAAASTATTGSAPVRFEFRNVHLHVARGVVLEVRHLEGSLLSTVPGKPPVFDDQRSFSLRIDSGEVAMTPASLTRLLNDFVFAYPKAPISNIDVSIESGKVKQKGTLHKGVSIPFTILADLSATPDGRLRLHPVSTRTAGIPAQRLMKTFGIELADLIKSNQAHGIEVAGDDLLLSTDHLLPAPILRGHLTQARVDGDRLVETFGSGRAPRGHDRGNYMYYRGGVLRFGKLTMSDTDMELIDADPRDPFDFSPGEYVKQLVAGYSKNTTNGGLRVVMPDFDKASASDLRPTATTGKQ